MFTSFPSLLYSLFKTTDFFRLLYRSAGEILVGLSVRLIEGYRPLVI